MEKTNTLKKVLNILLIIILFILFFYLFHKLNTDYPNNLIDRIIKGINLVLIPALIALIIAYLADPLLIFFNEKLKIKKVLSVFLTIVIVLSILVILILLIVHFFNDYGRKVFNNIKNSNLLENIELWFYENGFDNVYEKIINLIKNYDYTRFLDSINNLIGASFSFLTTLILVPVFLFHFLYYKDKITKGIVKTLPKKSQEHVLNILGDSNTVIKAYFKSKVVSMFFLFLLFFIVYIIMGFDFAYAILFALLVSILDLIPYLGPAIGNIIPIIYIFANNGINLLYKQSLHWNPIFAVILLLIANALIQSLQSNVIVPKLAGKEMKIHPLLILVSMLFFGSILGIWGIILSIPLCGILIIIAKYVKSLYLNKEKEEVHE